MNTIDEEIGKIIERFVSGFDLEAIDIMYPDELDMETAMRPYRINRIRDWSDCDSVFLMCFFTENKLLHNIISDLEKISNNKIIIVALVNDIDLSTVRKITDSGAIQIYHTIDSVFFLYGFGVRNIERIAVPDEFRVLAIIHCYNESDIIKQVIEYLLMQELDIYIVDNWSTDGTYEIACECKDRNPERIFLERFPQGGPTEYYEWYEQLARTEMIARIHNYNWYIHYDTDEMRVSPWKNTTLRKAVYIADLYDANIIENTVIEFKITDPDEDGLFMKDSYFMFGDRPAHFMQQKTWKNTSRLDLKESGGHLLKVEFPRIFPLKILNRHYPFRSIDQAEKKVLRDRKPRFAKEMHERGWHHHYDKITNKNDFVFSKEGLLFWDENCRNKYFTEFFLGCGIVDEDKDDTFSCPDKIREKRVLLHGAGKHGRVVYKHLYDKCSVVEWVDANYVFLPRLFGLRIKDPELAKYEDADFVVIAIKNSEICMSLIEKYCHRGWQRSQMIVL